MRECTRGCRLTQDERLFGDAAASEGIHKQHEHRAQKQKVQAGVVIAVGDPGAPGAEQEEKNGVNQKMSVLSLCGFPKLR